MISLRWYQLAAKAAVFDYFANNTVGNCLIGLPTGTGKGYVIADICRDILQKWPDQRILMLTHVRELISQNADKMRELWPLAPLGIYSAGLAQRDTVHPLLFAGVASVYKRIAEFGRIDLLFIDEAHLLSPSDDTMYGSIIEALKAVNPYLRVIGLTATPYRMGQGMLTDGGLFNALCYDMTDVAGFNRLIYEGYMSPIYPKPTHTAYDVSNVKIVNGDFDKSQLEAVVDKKDLTHKILEETCYYAADRQCWMFFASGVNHAEHIAQCLREDFRISAWPVHSKMSRDTRNGTLSAFKAGQFRCLVCNNIGTTGFDHPPVDFIGMGRVTTSPGLWVQMAGRGTRPSIETGKRDCLLLDFAKNTKRLGPINDPLKPRKKGEATGDAPVKICPECGIYNHASARECFACGCLFPFREKLVSTASTDELLRSDAPEIIYFDVQRTLYNFHQSKKKEHAKPCLKVSYICGLKKFDEWVHLDAGGSAGHLAREWWRQRHAYEPPTPNNCQPYPSATHAALSLCRELKQPKKIKVIVNRPYPQVLSVEY